MRFILAALILIAAPLYAFEDILPSPVSLGGAYTSVSAGYDSMYYNPAGFTYTKNHSITISQARLYFDTYAYEIGITGRLGSAAFASGFKQDVIQNEAVKVIVYNPDGTPQIDPVTGEIVEETLGFADRVDSRLNIGFAVPLGILSFGTSCHLIQMQHGSDSAYGFGVNAGLISK